MTVTSARITLARIRAAALALEDQIVRTPCTRSATLSEITGTETWVKFENLQFTASFKERGAFNRLRGLSRDERKRGVIAVSAGNHAQGVAYHAGRMGIPATIVMPQGTPFVKVEHTEKHGARVLISGTTLIEAQAKAESLAKRNGFTFIHPYDDPDIIAGQGTVALEMLEAAPDLDLLIVPVGGGGLVAGMAVAAKAVKPAIALLGVEVASHPSMRQALRGEAPTAGGDTIAEGIAVKAVGRLTLPLVKKHVDDVVLVSDAEVERAVSLYINVEKSVAEGAGAVALAAALAYPEKIRGRKIGLVLSGGNIDTRVLASVLMRQMVRDGRIVALRVVVPDRPGSLGRITSCIGDAGGNIIEAVHQRLFTSASVKAADIDLTVECRSPKHGAQVVAALRTAGFAVTVLAGVANGEAGPIAG